MQNRTSTSNYVARAAIAAILASVFTLLATSSAVAYELRLVQTSPAVISVGELAVFELYLDTQGESDIAILSAGTAFDDSRFAYRSDLSTSASYVLYSAGTGIADPARWLKAPDNAASGGNPTRWPVAGTSHVNADFVSNNILSGDGNLVGTTATADNALIATIIFEATATGTANFALGLDLNGNTFAVTGLSENVTDDIASQVSTIGDFNVTVVPEPSTALLIGLGLAGVARVRRNR